MGLGIREASDRSTKEKRIRIQYGAFSDRHMTMKAQDIYVEMNYVLRFWCYVYVSSYGPTSCKKGKMGWKEKNNEILARNKLSVKHLKPIGITGFGFRKKIYEYMKLRYEAS